MPSLIRKAPVKRFDGHAKRELARLGTSSVPLGWTLSNVGSACEIRNDLRLPLSVDVRKQMSGDYPYYGPTGVLGHIDEYRVEGTFALIGEDGDHFLSCQSKPQTLRVSGQFNVNNHAHIVGRGPSCDVDWFFYFFQHRDIASYLTRQGAGRYKLTKTTLEQLPILLPTLSEQRTIATILSTWDAGIEKLNDILVAMKRAQSAVSQRLFEEDYASGENLLRARELFMPVSERARPDLPLLAVMQDIGIVRRDELDRRVAMPDGDTSTYKVVRPGDFVISLRSFEGGLEYSKVMGLVSPAYTVLRPTRNVCADYYRYFFKSLSFVGRLDKIIFGIRDGKQIAFRDFGDMFIPHPPIEEQERHEKVLNTSASLIDINLRKKRSLELQKRGLMQKLLTGEWRVPC